MTVADALLQTRPKAAPTPAEPRQSVIEVEDRTDPEIQARIEEEALETQLLSHWVAAERAAGNLPN